MAVLAAGAVWMVVLRPSSGASGGSPAPAAAQTPAHSGPTAPGVRGLGRAVQHARDAAAGRPAGAAAPAATPHVAGSVRVTPAPARAASTAAKAPAASRSAFPASPRAAAPQRPTLLLFAGAGADDALARQVVRSFRGSHMRTIISSLAHVDLYKGLIGNLTITTSPTLLVIAPDLRARQIVGLPDRAQVVQALASLRHG